MSAEILRRAAALMRERAKAATPGPWQVDLEDGADYVYDVTSGTFCFVPDNGCRLPVANAAHIASWHPAVALAVAKAMDDVAHAWEIADDVADGYVYDADDNHYTFEETVDGGWLAVARSYLGESA